jgi:hypothetical protein
LTRGAFYERSSLYSKTCLNQSSLEPTVCVYNRQAFSLYKAFYIETLFKVWFNKTKVLLPQAYVTLADFGYSVLDTVEPV